MILLIDGDNGPGINTKNMEQLSENDKAVIYYASDNKYYAKDSNKSALIETAGCEIEFKCIPAGNCAVDLAVAMDSTLWLNELPDETIVLVSNDKHFGIISNLACRRFGNCSIVQAASVSEAIKKYRILEMNDLSDVHNWLVYTLGDRAGRETYNKLDRLFDDKHAKSGPENVRDTLIDKLPKKWDTFKSKTRKIIDQACK